MGGTLMGKRPRLGGRAVRVHRQHCVHEHMRQSFEHVHERDERDNMVHMFDGLVQRLRRRRSCNMSVLLWTLDVPMLRPHDE